MLPVALGHEELGAAAAGCFSAGWVSAERDGGLSGVCFLSLNSCSSAEADIGLLRYQIYVNLPWKTTQNLTDKTKDSLQAFSSSIAGLLASRAVLEGNPPPKPQVTVH